MVYGTGAKRVIRGLGALGSLNFVIVEARVRWPAKQEYFGDE